MCGNDQVLRRVHLFRVSAINHGRDTWLVTGEPEEINIFGSNWFFFPILQLENTSNSKNSITKKIKIQILRGLNLQSTHQEPTAIVNILWRHSQVGVLEAL